MNRRTVRARGVWRTPASLLAAASALGFSIAAASPASATPTVETLRDVDAATIASTLLGDGVELISATVTGTDVQVGAYSGLNLGESAPNLSDGAALTTGSLVDAEPDSPDDVNFTRSALVGPNTKLTTTGDLGGPGDRDLTSAFGATTYDAAALSLTLVPDGPNLTLSFLLGSEEYAGWSEQEYSDAAGIWVNGELCSLVPGTATPAGVATVNPTANSSMFHSNFDGRTPGAAFDTEFNGFTSELECAAAVTPGRETIVKIAVGDTRDGQLDTTVLVGAESITAPRAEEPPTPTQPGQQPGANPGTRSPATGDNAQPAANRVPGRLGSTGVDAAVPTIIAAAIALLGGGLLGAHAWRARRARRTDVS